MKTWKLVVSSVVISAVVWLLVVVSADQRSLGGVVPENTTAVVESSGRIRMTRQMFESGLRRQTEREKRRMFGALVALLIGIGFLADVADEWPEGRIRIIVRPRGSRRPRRKNDVRTWGHV